jgi:hypothetical protein
MLDNEAAPIFLFCQISGALVSPFQLVPSLLFISSFVPVHNFVLNVTVKKGDIASRKREGQKLREITIKNKKKCILA